jgi:hypothetical protein
MSKDKRDADDHGLLDEQQIGRCARVGEMMLLGHDVGVVGRHVPDSGRAPDGPAHEIHWRG